MGSRPWWAGVPAVDAALAVTEVATAVDWLVELDCVVVEVADEVDADEEVCVAELLVVPRSPDAVPAEVDGVPATLATAVVAAVLDVTGLLADASGAALLAGAVGALTATSWTRW